MGGLVCSGCILFLFFLIEFTVTDPKKTKKMFGSWHVLGDAKETFALAGIPFCFSFKRKSLSGTSNGGSGEGNCLYFCRMVLLKCQIYELVTTTKHCEVLLGVIPN